MEQYGKKGVSVDMLVQAQIDKAARDGRTIDYDTAYEEVIADSCESLLSDGEVIKKLAELKARDEGLFEKIKSFITKLVARIKKAYAGMKPDSYEGRIVSEMVDEGERLKELFADALLDASEARASGAKVEKPGVDIMYSVGDSEYSDYDKRITQGDIQKIRDVAAAHGGKRVSINDFTSDDIKATQKWAHKFYKELGTKSPFFRAWFGDWRAHDQSKIFPVPVSNIDLEDVVMQNGDYSNEDTGWSIRAGSLLYGDTMSHARGEKISVKALNDIENILKNAVLFNTILSERDKSKKSSGTAFMHKLYCPITYRGEIYIAKVTVEEYLNAEDGKVKRRGYNLRAIKIEAVNGSLTDTRSATAPVVESASIDSISDLYRFVKTFDKEISAAPEANPFMLEEYTDENGVKRTRPKVFYHGAKKNGGFTVFRDWQYFTEQKQYAERYAERGNSEAMYAVYLTANKIFDTRNKDCAEIFDSIRQEYGLGELQDTGLPDWTDGYDITDYLDNHSELGYDAIILDEGGDLVNGEPVSRGLSIVIKDSTQIKSATDNIGTFDKTNDDIRYSGRDPIDIEQYKKVNRQLEKENAELKEDVVALKELVKLQRKVTHGQVLKPSSLDAVARNIMRESNAKGDTKEFSRLISDVYQYIINGQDVTWEGIIEKSQPAVQWLLNHDGRAAHRTEFANEVLSFFKGYSFSLSEGQKKRSFPLRREKETQRQ